MTRQHRTKPRAKLLRSLYIWHRYLGLAAALFVIVLAATGLLLNHTEELELDAIRVTSPALLDWYGVRAPDHVLAYRAGNLTVIDAGGRIFLPRGSLPNVEGPLHGAVEFAGMVVVATGDQLLLLDPAGELVERLDGASGVPPDILSIGVTGDGTLALRTVQGIRVTDADFLAWQPAEAGDTQWATSTRPTAGETEALNRAWRGDGLPLERVMLDLHSGRILGHAGVYLMDAAAILFLVLAASGVWLWIKRRLTARAHRQKTGQHEM
jgi:hypothetical protein